jgi:hypothetical protein
VGRRDPGDGQLDLLGPPPRPDPDQPGVKLPALPRTTQVQAALRALPSSGSKRGVLLAMFQSIHRVNGGGYTDDELARYTTWGLNTIRPRRLELVEAGWVRDSGETRPTQGGSPAIVWVFVPEGGRAG